ncbi:Iml3p KNAG_0B01510 [Huiozyma naganishii CBS 8797]|uniref:Uncharacterized protein n=1 Tax=Huiozyma naganishii (strain ATCC MYA-139 / BCRC 22969 / CBS 8797 / KCTC 17520 / NBRC 10181 / NCYC 3082 / Yp74L-3) TaxID=1071383 RepID=J7RGD2_HUIN7|nr:hypothetical protein KNAG_0B01510 [Kazachstania naganishii CBS 8797]CCK68598.1 hypothetical protein KNAG_0B01510 [Kazachstania naganishii CBS 8797]
MPILWNCYGFNKVVDIDPVVIGLWEVLLDSAILYHDDVLNVDGLAIDDQRDDDIVRRNITIEGPNFVFRLVFREDKMGPVSALCYAEDISLRDTWFNWLKNSLGIIIWPLSFNTDQMFSILDAQIVGNKGKLYDTKLIFQDNELDDEETSQELKYLGKYSIEISKFSIGQLVGDNRESVYLKKVLPYLYEKTGFKVLELPIKHIILTNLITVRSANIVTQKLDVTDEAKLYIYSLIEGYHSPDYAAGATNFSPSLPLRQN